MIAIRRGATRRVIVLGPWAFKLARGEMGRRCNRSEAEIYETERDAKNRANLCPVRWCSPWGFVLVMNAARPLEDWAFSELRARGKFPGMGLHAWRSPLAARIQGIRGGGSAITWSRSTTACMGSSILPTSKKLSASGGGSDARSSVLSCNRDVANNGRGASSPLRPSRRWAMTDGGGRKGRSAGGGSFGRSTSSRN